MFVFVLFIFYRFNEKITKKCYSLHMLRLLPIDLLFLFREMCQLNHDNGDKNQILKFISYDFSMTKGK